METQGKNYINSDIPIHLSELAVFELTYKNYYHPLCFYASKFVKPADAEDIIENLFLKLWNIKKEFASTAYLQAFLYHAVRNACLDHIKVSKNASQRYAVVQAEEVMPDLDHLNYMIQAETLAEIYRAVNELPSQCSKVIRMGYLEGFKNSEIAAELGLSEQTVKNYKKRGLTILKDKLSGNAFILFALFFI